jgi:hypothetical protein
MEVKNLVAEYYEQNPTKYANFITNSQNSPADIIRADKEYATYEMIAITVDALQQEIHIYRGDRSYPGPLLQHDKLGNYP